MIPLIFISSVSLAQIGANMPFVIDQYLGIASGSDMTPAYQKVVNDMGRKGIRDAKYSGMKLIRTTAGSWGPVFYHVKSPNSYKIWMEDPNRFWAMTQVMLDDYAQNGISLAISLVWTIETFPSITRETVRDLITNPSSKSSILQKKFIQEYIQRFKNHPAVKIWELHNELNLYVDIDMVKFCQEQWKEHIKTPEDRINFCGSAGNFTTDEMIAYSRRVVSDIRQIDSAHPITAGYAAPRISAEHLRKRPQFAPQGPDWTKDSADEFLKNIRDTNASFDIISVHIYSGVDITSEARPYIRSKDPKSTEIIDWCNWAANKIGKPLFVGEFFDAEGTFQPYPFTMAALKKIEALKIPFSALWVWEFYPANTYQHQNPGLGQIILEPGFSDELILLVRELNRKIGHDVFSPAKEDKTPPELIITWPLDGKTAEFVNVVSTDDSLLAPVVEILLNDKSIATLSKAPYKLTLPKLEKGSYKLTAIAKDAASNTTQQSIQMDVP